MPESAIDGVTGNAVTPEFCTAQFQAFDDRDRFSEVGGWGKLNAALGGKWVLVMSLWDDVRFYPPSISDPILPPASTRPTRALR